MGSQIVTVINKTKQGIPLLVLDGGTNKTVSIPPKGPDGYVRIEKSALTAQVDRLVAQGRVEVK